VTAKDKRGGDGFIFGELAVGECADNVSHYASELKQSTLLRMKNDRRTFLPGSITRGETHRQRDLRQQRGGDDCLVL
jgi:hypothetical protein